MCPGVRLPPTGGAEKIWMKIVQTQTEQKAKNFFVAASTQRSLQFLPSASIRASRFLNPELTRIRTHATHPKRDIRGILADNDSIDTLGVRKNAGAGAPNCFLRKAYCDFAC